MLFLSQNIAALLAKGDFDFAFLEMDLLFITRRRAKALSLLQLEAETLLTRIELIDSSSKFPEELLLQLRSIVFAANRVEVEELKDAVEQFSSKFGSKFINQLLLDPSAPPSPSAPQDLSSANYGVRRRLQRWLTSSAPPRHRLHKDLCAIANANGLPNPPFKDADADRMVSHEANSSRPESDTSDEEKR